MNHKCIKKFGISFSILLLTFFSYPTPFSLTINTNVASESFSLRRVKPSYLKFLLDTLTPDVIADVESQRKFVIHSGPSGVGQGTIKEKMLELYPDRFQRFLLYATRARRGLRIDSSDSRYSIIKTYIQMAELGETPSSMEEFVSRLPEDQKRVIKSLTNKQRKELEEVLFPDWGEILAGAPRSDIPSIAERFAVSEKNITAYKEFNGIHYWFVSEKELFRLRDEEGIIVEPVRDYYQGLDPRQIRNAIQKGNGKIFILEGDRVWFDHVHRLFPEATSIFIAPISIDEFKKRMISKLGGDYQKEVEALNIWGLLRGGIEKFIAQEQSELIHFPADLSPAENKAFLNIKNAILAVVGYKILHPDVNIEEWLERSGLLREEDLVKVNARVEEPFTSKRIIEVANEIYRRISQNKLLLTAMQVIIEEMVGRIEHRWRSQGKDPQAFPQLAETYVRASQSPREYGGSSDYGDMLVNRWGELNNSVRDLTTIILERLLQDTSIP